MPRRFPYRWDLNLYRGCAHGCVYCYAQYSHAFLGNGTFARDIYVKTNVIEKLEQQLCSRSWTREIINIGGVTDSYQPAEERFRLMPDVWRLLIRTETPAVVSTKSDLILRDIDLIEELSRITYVNVASTVTTLDAGLQKRIEPGTVSPERRLRMLKAFRKTNASTGLHVMPVIPELTDSLDNLDGLFRRGKDCDVDYLLAGMLYLRGTTRELFLEWLLNEDAQRFERFSALCRPGRRHSQYREMLYQRIQHLRMVHDLRGDYSKAMETRFKQTQDCQLEWFMDV